MRLQVFGRLRRPAAAEIVGARAQRPADRRDPPRHQARIRQGADAQRHVEAVVDQVDEAVVEREIDVDLRKAGEEFRQRRREVQEAEAHRRADLEPPARARLKLAERAVGVVEIGENAAHPLEIGAAGLGQVQRARGAVEEPRAELGLERPDVSADRRFRRAKPRARPRRTTGSRRPGQTLRGRRTDPIVAPAATVMCWNVNCSARRRKVTRWACDSAEPARDRASRPTIGMPHGSGSSTAPSCPSSRRAWPRPWLSAAAARVSGSRHVATLAAPVVFLVSYVVTYQKIPPFPPLGAANKVFYVALAATLGASALEAFARVPRWALAGPRLAARRRMGRLGRSWPIRTAATSGSVCRARRRRRPRALGPRPPRDAARRRSAAALRRSAGLAAVSALSAPALLFGGSSTGVGLCLGLAAGAAVLSAEALGAPRRLGPAAMLGAGSGLLAALDTIALVTRNADLLVLALIALAPFLGPRAVRLLPPALERRPVVAWVVSGLAVLSPLPVIVALLLLRHDNPLAT